MTSMPTIEELEAILNDPIVPDPKINPDGSVDVNTLERDIAAMLNKHSAENDSNSPDWILAQYLLGCLAAFNTAVQQRENWYGRDPRPSGKPACPADQTAETASQAKTSLDDFDKGGITSAEPDWPVGPPPFQYPGSSK